MTAGARAVDSAGREGTSPSSLLERLKARDKAFDNALLRYTTWGERRIDFPWWKYPPRTDEERALRDKGPIVTRFRFHEQMVVRGRDTTFTRKADGDAMRKGGAWSVGPIKNGGIQAVSSGRSSI